MKTCPACHRQFVDSQPACPFEGERLAPGSGQLPAGVGRVLGTYQLVGKLGEGGMGSIYVGRHARLDRYVAIKVLRPELANRREAITRFFDEAKIVNRIQHPNVVVSIDTVEDVVDGVYCVLELLRGRNLKVRLAGGALPIEKVIDIGAQIADALAAVHAQDVVHRDLKPENLILIEHDGRDDFVKLIDFGVAQTAAAVTEAAGTAAYMAPEQAANARVDARADLYALGVLLFEMIAGRHPFPSTTDPEYLVRHAHDEPPRLGKLAPWPVPPALAAIVMRCLAKDPAERFASAAEVAAALRGVDGSERERDRSRRWTWAAAGVVVAVAAGVTALVVPGLVADTGAAQASAPAPSAAAPAPPPPRAPPAPVVVEEPAAPEQVTLAFSSTPAGASVFREGESVALGTTPFSTTLLRSDRVLRVRFELAGYDAKTVEVSLADSAEVATPLVAHAAPKRTVVRPRLQREGVMDPFANEKVK